MRGAFVVLWLALVMAPIAQWVYPFVLEGPIQENRVLAHAPQLNWDALRDPLSVAKSAYAWFNDNFGLRITLIRAWTEVNYALGHSERIHIGPDGWLHYRSVLEQKVQNESLKEADLRRIANQLAQIREHLAARNVHMLVVTIPQKDVIYPETLPADAPIYPNPTVFERMRALLTARFGTDHIDSEPLLARLKARNVPAFHKTDFHWTDAGGNEAARAIVNRIADLENRPDLRWSTPAPMQSVRFIGGESQQLPLFTYVSEQTIKSSVDWQDPARGSFDWTNADQHFNPRFPLSYSFIWTPVQAVGLPPVAVLSNSYGEAFWYTGMHFHFSKVYSFRFNSPGVTLEGALPQLSTDVKYFVLQFHEAQLSRIAKAEWIGEADSIQIGK